MVWLIVIGVAIVLLFALAWWSSGRSRRRLGRPDPSGEIARGDAVNRANVHRPPGASGPGGF